jgi:hypothetical protein
MIEQPTHAYEGRGATVRCANPKCGKRFQVVGPKKPKVQPACPYCGHDETEAAA